jgi:hypothetical protein
VKSLARSTVKLSENARLKFQQVLSLIARMSVPAVISGVQDLPQFYFARGAQMRLTVNMDSEFPLSGKFVEFGIQSRSGTVRRIFRTDLDEANVSVTSQVLSIVIDPADETVPAFTGGWTLADVQAAKETQYWVDFSATEGSPALLRLQGYLDWIAPGDDIPGGSSVISAPEVDVTISSGAVAVTVSVVGGEVGVPVGGTTGQVLRKTSGSDYATEWATVAGTGDVVGPASATDNAIARFDSNSGKAVQNSGITIADGATGTLSGTNTGDQDLSGYVLTASIDTLAELNAVVTDATLIDTNDSRLSDARTPTAHTHEGTAILSTGETGGTKFLREDGDGTSSWQAISGGGDALVANNLDQFADVTQAAGQTLAISSSTTLSGGTHSGTNTGDQDLSGYVLTASIDTLAELNAIVTDATLIDTNDSRLSDARTPTSHTHGNITNAGAIGSTSGLPIKTGTSGVLEAGAFGTGAGQFAEGNHNHSGVYAPVLGSDDNYVTDAEKAALHAAATVSGNGISISGQQISLDIGTGADQVAAGNDSRFGKDLTIVTDATAAVTLDSSNCYPDYIRCTSGSAVTLTLAAGQSAAVGRHWIIRQAAAGVATVSANDSTPAAITRNGDPSTAGQHTEIAVILVADGVVDIVGGAA